MKIEGDKQLKNLLAQLPKRVASKGNKAAVTAGAKPIVKAAKNKAPKESGALRKAMGSKVKTYKADAGTSAVAVIGARRNVTADYKGKPRVPSRYIHLVDKGTKYIKGDNFLEQAYEEEKNAALEAMKGKFKEVIEREASKLGKE